MSRVKTKKILKSKFFIITLILLSLLALTYYIYKSGEELNENVVATVNGEAIFLKDLEERMSMIRINYPPDSGVSLEDIKHNLINRMIIELLAVQDAKRHGLKVSNRELDIAARSIKEPYSEEEFDQILMTQFIDHEDWMENLRRLLLIEKLMSKQIVERINIEEPELIKIYEEHYKGKMTEPAVEIAQIFTKSRDKAKRAIKELREGQSFEYLVSKYSESPETEKGGFLGIFTENEGPEIFDNAFKMEEEEVSGILESDFGYHIIKLIRKIPEGEITYDQARKEIENDLVMEQEQKYYREWLERMFRESKIIKNIELIESIR